jgi:hypothetical protein
MTDSDRIARATRAQAAYDEFVHPILTECRTTYGDRIVEIASTELSREKRTDKLTALSLALRILEQVESGIQSAIMDGEVAANNVLRVEKMDSMTAPQRRLFGLVPTA